MELRQKELGLDPGQFIDSSDKPTIVKENHIENDEYYINRMHELAHTSRSDYSSFLRKWLKYFDKRQLLIIDFEKVAIEPRAVLKQIGDHIGVSSVYHIPQVYLENKVNIGTASTSSMSESVRSELNNLVKPYVKSFNALLDELGGYDWKLHG